MGLDWDFWTWDLGLWDLDFWTWDLGPGLGTLNRMLRDFTKKWTTAIVAANK
jgi:hypothetical protein